MATQPDQPAGVQAVISIGSNVNAEAHVPEAIDEISRAHRVIACSHIARTDPVGPADQRDYLNAAIRIQTPLMRERLRQWLRDLEDRMGRQRSADKYAPRTIDLDIVVWDGHVVHADAFERDYLREQIIEVWPEMAKFFKPW